jgi:TRAP-type mannitol/chloroaromatic compound transport system substrate-binding protein
VADLQGLKMRIGGIGGMVLEKLGTVPQQIPASDLYSALEKGTIDAAEWVGPYDDQKLGFVKVAPYYYYPGFWEGSAQLEFFINQKAFDALSAENKAILEAAAAMAHIDIQAKYDARNPAALKQLVAGGAKLRAFPNDMMNEAFKISNQIYAETSAKNPAFKKIYDDMAKFRADANLWFRFTEMSFDRFMQSQKL